ncbi:MAG: hypothetical protein WC520_00950, partial [Candidatus Paceibacterota bacterium]
KRDAFLDFYKKLSPEIRDKVNMSHEEAEKSVAAYISGKGDIENLSEGENFILNRIRNEYREFERSKSTDQFSFGFTNEADKLVYANLLYKLSFISAGLMNKPKKIEEDQENEEDLPPVRPVTRKQVSRLPLIESDENVDLEVMESPQTLDMPDLDESMSEVSQVTLSTDLGAKQLTIAYLKNKDNFLDRKKALKLVNVIKEWVVCGGNLYSYLVGRALRLRKGIDYEINPDGTVNQNSFATVAREKVNEWLSKNENREWILAARKFKADHGKRISYEKRKVKIRVPRALKEVSVYVNPYFYENGHLCYESNCFDETKGDMRQPEREETKYRISINVGSENVINVFESLLSQFSKDEELLRVGFAAETPALFEMTAENISEAMNRKDKIAFYLGEKGITRALPIIQKYTGKNSSIFNKEGLLLAQPLFDNLGKQVPGVVISSEVSGTSPDSSRGFPKYASYNAMQAEIVMSSIESIIKALTSPEALTRLGQSNPILKQKILKIAPQNGEQNYLKVILSQKNGDVFLADNLIPVYYKWSKAFGMSENNLAFEKEERQETEFGDVAIKDME